jgi:hypothetical protein
MRLKLYFYTLFSVFLLTLSCKKSGSSPTISSGGNVKASMPVVSTSPIQSLSQTSAVSGGVIVSDGGSAILAKGVCWSTSPGPTISNYKDVNGVGISSFSSSISGLTANTTYYVRAYATNAIGTAYGDELSFKTLVASSVYAVGNSYFSATGKYWINNVLVDISTKTFAPTDVTSIFISGGDVYMVGNSIGKYPFLWKNGVVYNQTLSYSRITDVAASSLFVSGSDTYVAGTYSLNGGLQKPVYWKNGVFSDLSTTEGWANSICVANSNVYVGGSSQNLPTIWKNGVPTTLSSQQGEVTAVVVSGNDVYAVGCLFTIDYNKAMLWKNGTAVVLAESGTANSVAISGSDVYVVGVSGYASATLWKNGTATLLTDGTDANAVFVKGTDVYIGGAYKQLPAIWKNGKVSTLYSTNGVVNSIFIDP